MSFSFEEIISTRKTRSHAGGHYLDIKCGNLMQHAIIHCETPYVSHSLVPRPYPLMRRNGLVNQVEFLGLVHALATM